MLLIAESGSTKTQWATTGREAGEYFSFISPGINPYTQKEEEISRIIESEVFPKMHLDTVDEIAFYGAGCSTAANKEKVRRALASYFPKADIYVDHDLLAAAIALSGKKQGIAMILGTGSNSCVFDGKEIVSSVPALGYILGDEGSGAHLGKGLVRDFLYRKMPGNLHQGLEEIFNLDKDLILKKVYQSPNPNRWLASLTPFLLENIGEEYCRNLVTNSFREFFDAHIAQYGEYKDWPLGAVGSIAYHFKALLGDVAQQYGFRLEKVIQSPIYELINYHQTYPLRHGKNN